MTSRFLTPRTAALAVAVAMATSLSAVAGPGHDHHGHDHGAAQGGHDHSQHHHSSVLKIGSLWEAGLDVTDWSKPAKACPAHPQIVSNEAGSNCPITTALKIDRPTTAPKGAAKRVGLVLLPAKGHKHLLTDARIHVTGTGIKRLALSQKDGYYWVDLPASAKGPLTLEVQQGGKTQQARLAHL
jgi:hypothetical protein